jgi:hypothetical protein
VPDHGVEGEEALQDTCPEPGGDTGVVMFEPEDDADTKPEP